MGAYTGVSMVHGVILDPEASCDQALVEKLGQGTVTLLGPRGQHFSVQRYGSDLADHRSSFYKMVLCPEGPSQLHEAIGVPANSSWHRGDSLQKIREYLRADMGEGWEPAYSSVIDALDFAAVRPILLHDRAPTFRDNDLPLICIGDSLHVVPPWTGRGGNLAMADALDVGMWLVDLLQKSKPISIEGLRRVESQCMVRSAKETDDAHKFPEYIRTMQEKFQDTPDMSSFSCLHFADVVCENRLKSLCFRCAVCSLKPCCTCCGCCRC